LKINLIPSTATGEKCASLRKHFVCRPEPFWQTKARTRSDLQLCSECMFQKSLQLAPAVIVNRRVRGTGWYVAFEAFKKLWQTRGLEQRS